MISYKVEIVQLYDFKGIKAMEKQELYKKTQMSHKTYAAVTLAELQAEAGLSATATVQECVDRIKTVGRFMTVAYGEVYAA